MPSKGYKKPLEQTAEYRRKHGLKTRKKKAQKGPKNSPNNTPENSSKNRIPAPAAQTGNNSPENSAKTEPIIVPKTEQKIEAPRATETAVQERPMRRCDIIKEAYSYKPTKADLPGIIDIRDLSERDQTTLRGFFSASIPGEVFAPDELQAAMADYIAHVMHTNKNAPLTERRVGSAFEMVRKLEWIPTVDGFTLYAGIPLSTFKKLAVRQGYTDMCESFRAWCKTFTMEETLKDKLPPIPAIFVMKAENGMVEATAEKTTESTNERLGQAMVNALFAEIRQKRQLNSGEGSSSASIVDAVDVRVVGEEKTAES